jgi:S-adenosylmethionine-diacylglycerol 3-amino-3-carboxypropyl transferase
MSFSLDRIRKTWFEIRIFISLSIVIVISFISFLFFAADRTTVELIGSIFGISGAKSIHYGYFIIALIVLIASLIRMWAGSVLTSGTVMSFAVQNKKFMISGPYIYVRNPIYYADLIAFSSLSLCLRPVGLLIPVLIYIHYYQLIKYEEKNLDKEFGKSFSEYLKSTPALLPGFKQFAEFIRTRDVFAISFDGFRHNAQYILFIPGLIFAAYTGKFIHALLIGLPAVVDWAVIHTIIGLSPEKHAGKDQGSMKNRFSGSKVFRDILYAQCWEDPEIDRIAFRIKPDDIVFSITSGGCNALSFLIDDPKKVICLDLSRYQNYLLSLKINAFRALSYDELLEFLGVHHSDKRAELYGKIKQFLPAEEQLYWNSKSRDISRGIIHCGRYERYMHLLKRLFRILTGRRVIDELYATAAKDEREILFAKKWDNIRWRLFCRIFLSRRFASMFFDKAFYQYLDKDFSFEKYYRSAVKRAVTELPLKENHFLAYILFGNYYQDNFPVYLRRENYNLIRDRLGRVEIVTTGCQDYFRSLPEGSISKFNFTNIFEWMSPDEFIDLLRETIRVATDGAILTYRNHLVTRKRPESLMDQIIPDEKRSVELHEKDLSFIYKAYIVEQIRKHQ